MRALAILIAVLALCFAAAASADEKEEHEEGIEFFYPLTLRRPVIETLFDFTARHQKARDGRETELAPEIEWAAFPWWKVAVELPVLIQNPGHRTTLGGIGDLGIENSFMLYKSREHQIQLLGGFELKLPTGAKTLGGETAIEPFLVGGIRFGSVHLIADYAYEWTLHSPESGPRSQELTGGLAAAYEVTERFLTLLEMKTVRVVRGGDSALRNKQQFYLTPGMNFKFTDEVVLRYGVELPVRSVREFDYALNLGLSWEF
jgi:hypothetical protein